jgi:nucleoside-diphosphate-sugar epimerase
VDLTDLAAVEAMLDRARPDAVIHMAALSDVTVSITRPLETFHASATTSATLFEAVRRCGRRVPVISHTTDKVYGANEVPFREAMPLRPFHVYEVAKAAQDMLGRFYGKQYGLPVVTVRCGNYFGPDDPNFNRIVPYAIRQALRGEEIVLRSDGSYTRDFLYVEDAAGVNLLLLDALLDEAGSGRDLAGEALNFSLEVQLTVREMVETICRLVGTAPRIRVEASAKAEIPDMRLDCSRARELFGWVPPTPLEPALRRTIEAYRAQLEAKAPPRSASPPRPWHGPATARHQDGPRPA